MSIFPSLIGAIIGSVSSVTIFLTSSKAPLTPFTSASRAPARPFSILSSSRVKIPTSISPIDEATFLNVERIFLQIEIYAFPNLIAPSTIALKALIKKLATSSAIGITAFANVTKVSLTAGQMVSQFARTSEAATIKRPIPVAPTTVRIEIERPCIAMFAAMIAARMFKNAVAPTARVAVSPAIAVPTPRTRAANLAIPWFSEITPIKSVSSSAAFPIKGANCSPITIAADSTAREKRAI